MKFLNSDWVKGGFFAISLVVIYELGKHNTDVETYDLKKEVQQKDVELKLLRDSFTAVLLGKAP